MVGVAGRRGAVQGRKVSGAARPGWRRKGLSQRVALLLALGKGVGVIWSSEKGSTGDA